MKLLLINGNTDPGITALILDRAQAALLRLGLGHLRLEAATAAFGARYIATRAAVAVAVAGHAVLDALARHLRAGHAGAIIACFGEPGLDAAREILAIPVQGMAEASLAIGHRIAPRIAFLTGGAAWVPMLEEFCLLPRRRPRPGAGPPRRPDRGHDRGRSRGGAGAAGRVRPRRGGRGLRGGGAGWCRAGGLGPALGGAAPVPVLDSLDCALLRAAEAGRNIDERITQAPQDGLSSPLAALLGAH